MSLHLCMVELERPCLCVVLVRFFALRTQREGGAGEAKQERQNLYGTECGDGAPGPL